MTYITPKTNFSRVFSLRAKQHHKKKMVWTQEYYTLIENDHLGD